jgi:PHS family inorganic phosphate transporter-like MFS transporter
MADVVGRKKIFVATAVLISFGSILSSSSVDSPSWSIYSQIACWRFFLGAGVGGEYPLAATVTSESSSAAKRGTLMAGVFSMQGIGSLLSVIVVLICLSSGQSTEFTWRFALAFGAVPALIAFPFRLLMHETESFEQVKQNRKLTRGTGTLASAIKKDAGDAFKLYKWHMLGTALCWFLLDVDFYANGLFSHEVTAKILSPDSGKTTAYQDTVNSSFLCLISVPGYYLAVLYMERVGRKNMQRNGFLAMAVCFTICGAGHDWFLDGRSDSYRRTLFLVVYALTFLFSNFGPNTSTFVIPGEIYPPEVRATCHGVSAASGKLGAAAGAYFFPLVLGVSEGAVPNPAGLKLCFYICAIVAVVGAMVTTVFIPTYGAAELEREEKYFPLDYACLHPPMDIVNQVRLSKSENAYDMVEVIESACDYSLDDEDGVTVNPRSKSPLSKTQASLANYGSI